MADILKSEKILKVASCIIYGIPVQGVARGQPRCGVPPFRSGIMVVCVWLSFGFLMYCMKTHWRSSSGPQIPIETLLLLISLDLSGVLTLTLMVWYFCNNDFQHSQTRLVPHFDFMPEGHQEDIGPERNDWKYVNILLFIGVGTVILVLYFALGLDVYFDFTGIHDFIFRVSNWEKVVYFVSVAFIYWGYISAVAACCTFYICCRDIVRHVQFTEHLIITKARKFLTARHYHECLLRYTDDVMNTTKLWFVVHSLFFMFIVLTDTVTWIMAFDKIKHDHDNMLYVMLAQGAGSSLIAYKFAFPFLAASCLTDRYDKMYRRINRQWRPDDSTEVGVFMSYCIRCEAGFKLFGIKVTTKLALISLLSCFIDFLRLYKEIF